MKKVPACYRHDFGYTNYRAQTRFTKSAKAAIDLNFLGEYVSYILPSTSTIPQN